jgi:hypothetical protein
LLLQVGFTVAAGLVSRLASVFSLFDQPMQQAAKPVPPHVLQVRQHGWCACFPVRAPQWSVTILLLDMHVYTLVHQRPLFSFHMSRL